MKKFLISFFILIVLGGLAFFFGWAQLKVPPGSYGIIRSKTHGTDPSLVRAGEFRWLWYKLIPGNVEITVLRLEPVTCRFSARNSLPSGDTYAAFAGASADFSWEINATLSFSINPEALITLVTDNTIGSQDTLDTWKKDLAAAIGAFIQRRLNSGDMNTRQLEEILKTGSSADLDREIAGQFPMISDFSCLLNGVKFPDLALYNEFRLLYEEFIAKQREYLSDALNQKAESRIDAQQRLNELTYYGELLTKYPVLLDFLALEQGKSLRQE